MKRTFMILGAAVLILSGCRKDELTPSAKDSSVAEATDGTVLLTATLEQPGGEADGTKTYLSGSHVYWTAGDAIKVYNSDGTQSAVLTAKTGGSSNTAFDGSGSFKPAYGIYPSACNPTISGSEISFDLPAAQVYSEDSFCSGTNVTVGKVSGNKIAFKNVCGALRLTITSLVGDGTIDHIKIVANSERLNGRFKADASSATPVATALEAPASEADRTVRINCKGTSGAAIGTSPKTYYAILPVNALKGGFAVYVCNEDESWAQPIDASNKSGKNTIERSKITNMPTFDVEVGVIDLSIKESANCYMVNKAGLYRFKAVVGNSNVSVENRDGDISPKTINRAAIFWETRENSVKANVIQGCDPYVKVVGNYKYVYFMPGENKSSGYYAGNAGIALLNSAGGAGYEADVNGHMLWSWHIWCVGENVVPGTNSYNSSVGPRYFMDRNLGAMSTDGDGFLYQWGRKEPFRGNFGISSGDYPLYSGTSTLTWYADANPIVFFNGDEGSIGHWNYDTAVNTKLWASTKTTSDPCPPGYRVPDPFGNITSDLGTWPVNGIRGLYNDAGWNSGAQYWACSAWLNSSPNGYVGSCYDSNQSNKNSISFCKGANPIRCEKIQ